MRESAVVTAIIAPGAGASIHCSETSRLTGGQMAG